MHWSLFASRVSMQFRIRSLNPSLCAVTAVAAVAIAAGYGIETTYEMAAFTNAAMIRHTDFNATPHNNEMFGGILAVGEARDVRRQLVPDVTESVDAFPAGGAVTAVGVTVYRGSGTNVAASETSAAAPNPSHISEGSGSIFIIRALTYS